MSSHLFIFDLHCFLMGFFCFNVHTGFLTFFAIIIKKSQKLNHSIIHKILMNTSIQFSFIKQCEKFIKCNHLISCKYNSVQQVIRKNMDVCFLSQQTCSILQPNITLFPFVYFIELFKQVLQITRIIILLHPFINIIIIQSYLMFCTLTERNHTFVRRQNSRLISVIPLCARTVIFFCDDLNFYHYSLMEEKILYQSKFPGRVRSAISLSGHQILCTVMQTRNLILLNIKQKSMDQICKLPHSKVYNEGKEKDLLSQITLNFFQKTHSFYLYEPNYDENKAKIIFHHTNKIEGNHVSFDKMISHEYSTKKMLIKKLDSMSKLVMFNQEIQDNGQFKFKTIDCARKFQEKQYALQHPAFTRFSIVNEIKSISKEDERQSNLIFINSSEPTVLIVVEGEVQESKYKLNKIFLSTILVNVDLGFGMFMFMPDPQDPDPSYTTVIELVSLADGVIQDSKKCNVHQVVKSFEDDYLLHFKPQNTATNLSVFRTDHIIGKKAHYMKMIQQIGLKDLSSEMLGMIINQLQY